MSRTELQTWRNLQAHAGTVGKRHLSELLAEADRFAEFSRRHEGLLLDFSKQRIDSRAVDLLLGLARECELESWIERLFAGEAVNASENRAALHGALRLPPGSSLQLDGVDIITEVQAALARMEAFVERIHAGQWPGYSGRPVDTIVNIGVGGSDLGPYMAARALRDARASEAAGLHLHFASTMDGSQLAAILDDLDPATTLFILQSKSFTTIDTLSNAETARQWLRRASGTDDAALLGRHFIGVSSADDKMDAWGIAPDNRLPMWDWVGGRYSMWSAIGLPVALQIGMPGFRQLLAGAHAMDEHFQKTELEQNLPVLLAMIGIWNVNFLDIRTHAILPYDGRLEHLPAYLQQLEMESNGKSVSRDGEPLDYATCPILWGQVGPNAQHAFYQLLHQGTEAVAADFIVAARRYHETGNAELESQHRLTLANCLDNAEGMPPFKRYRGNQPSSTLLLDELTPYSLGQLIALYEHKVFTQAVVWNINPFDQWGVELGKQMATALLGPLGSSGDGVFDPSTGGLLKTILEKQQSAN